MSKDKSKTAGKKIWSSILLTALGIVMILWRSASIAAIIRLIGVALIVIGAIGVIQQIISKAEKSASMLGRILISILFVGLGLWVLINPPFFESFLKYIIGGIIILFAAKDLIAAIRGKKHWAFIVLPFLALVVGILIVVYPFSAFGTFAMFGGIALSYTGIASLIGEWRK